MDELGRGTSTHDGVAIAHASCAYLAQNIKFVCTFFFLLSLHKTFDSQVPVALCDPLSLSCKPSS